MNKWLNLRQEIINLRCLLTNYKKIVPNQQLPRFEKDMNLLFENYQYIEKEQELENIKKLAKAKLNSMRRVYGEINEEETKIEKEFLDENSRKFNEKIINENSNSSDSKEDDYSSSDWEKRLINLKNSDYFNKEIVNKYHQDLHEHNNKILQSLKDFEKENLEKKKDDYKNDRQVWIEKLKEKLRNSVKEICMKKNVINYESTMQSIDFDKMAEHFIDMELNPEKYNNQGEDEKTDDLFQSFENILSGSRKTEDLFMNFRKNSILDTIEELSKSEDLKSFLDQKFEKIIKDESLSKEEKAKTLIKEQWKAENEIIKDKIDGEIRLNPYGNIEFDFFKEKNEEKEEDSEEKKEGIKTYHWKDGKLVEGKAKKRTTTTYSNWHSGNANPDDLKRHRSLLDRQHYSGPLWDGIKPKSVMNDPSVFLDIENYKNNKDDDLLKLDDKGKQEWEEIVR